jgi:hypothetical protein
VPVTTMQEPVWVPVTMMQVPASVWARVTMIQVPGSA